MDKRKEYERFKLQWMLNHGFTLVDIITELDKLIEELGPEMSLKSVFEDWEFGYGFGSEIWPCFGEWMDCEFQE